MNPNTGALIPVRHGAAAAAEGAAMGTQSPEVSQFSLLGTPAMPQAASAVKSQLPGSAQSAPCPVPAQGAAGTAAAAIRPAAGFGEQTQGRRQHAPATTPGAHPMDADAPHRPPSPKYDERAGGYFTPAATLPRRSRDQARPSSATTPAAAAARKHADAHAPLRNADQPLHLRTAHGRTAAPAAQQAGSDSDSSAPPSPKWDETVDFFIKPRTKPRKPRSTQHHQQPWSAAAARASEATTPGGVRRPATAAHEAVAHSTGGSGEPGHRTAATPPSDCTPNAAEALPEQHGTLLAAAQTPMDTAQAAGARGTDTPAAAGAFTGVRPRSTVSRLSAGSGAGAAKERVGVGFRTAVPNKGHQLTILSLEIIAAARGKLLPDPKHDAVLAVALTVWYDHEDVRDNSFSTRLLVQGSAKGPADIATEPADDVGAAAKAAAGPTPAGPAGAVSALQASTFADGRSMPRDHGPCPMVSGLSSANAHQGAAAAIHSGAAASVETGNAPAPRPDSHHNAATEDCAPTRQPCPTAAAVGAQLDWMQNEMKLLQALIAAVTALDPDIIVAFDIMRGSIGYLEARAQELGMQPSLLRQLGRCPKHPGVATTHCTLHWTSCLLGARCST